MAEEPFITLRNASFGYKGQPVLTNVSLQIERGEFVGLVGPNGAGKSTLFKGMLKLLRPLSGEVIHAPAIARRIGYVPQRDQLDAIYPLTAFDVARMAAVSTQPLLRFRVPDLRFKIEACLDKVDMLSKRDYPFAQLSGGQRQRVLIARALAINPQLLVLDEPTAGIDAAAEESILSLLAQLNKEQGLAIVMVSHNLASLRQRVHRALLIQNQTLRVGTAAELLDPARLMDFLS